jgi:hypothetical protein
MNIGGLIEAGVILLFFVYLGNYRLFRGLTFTVLGYVVGFSRLVWVILRGILKGFVLVILSAVVIAIYTVSVFVPTIGRVNISKKIQNGVDWLLGANKLQMFRDDVLEILSESESSMDPPPDDVEKELREIQNEAKRRHEDGELVAGLVSGLLILALQSNTGWLNFGVLQNLTVGLVIEIYFVVLSISVLLRVVLIDILAYEPDFHPEGENMQKLVVRWQRAILHYPSIQIGFIILGIVRILNHSAYPTAIQVFDEMMHNQLSVPEIVRRAHQLNKRS